MSTLDLQGVTCPMNFVKTKLKLETLATGDKLTVVLDDGEPIQNVPASLQQEGHAILESSDQGDGTWQVELVHLRAGYEGVWTALQE